MASYPTPDVFVNGVVKTVFNIYDFIGSATSATLADLRYYAKLNISNVFTSTQFFTNLMFSGTINGIQMETFAYINDLTAPVQSQLNGIYVSLSNWYYDVNTNTQGINNNTAFGASVGSIATNTQKLNCQEVKAIMVKSRKLESITVKCSELTAKNVVIAYLFNSGFTYPLVSGVHSGLPLMNFANITYISVAPYYSVTLLNLGQEVKTIVNDTGVYKHLEQYFGIITDVVIKEIS